MKDIQSIIDELQRRIIKPQNNKLDANKYPPARVSDEVQ